MASSLRLIPESTARRGKFVHSRGDDSPATFGTMTQILDYWIQGSSVPNMASPKY